MTESTGQTYVIGDQLYKIKRPSNGRPFIYKVISTI